MNGRTESHGVASTVQWLSFAGNGNDSTAWRSRGRGPVRGPCRYRQLILGATTNCLLNWASRGSAPRGEARARLWAQNGRPCGVRPARSFLPCCVHHRVRRGYGGEEPAWWTGRWPPTSGRRSTPALRCDCWDFQITPQFVLDDCFSVLLQVAM